MLQLRTDAGRVFQTAIAAWPKDLEAVTVLTKLLVKCPLADERSSRCGSQDGMSDARYCGSPEVFIL